MTDASCLPHGTIRVLDNMSATTALQPSRKLSQRESTVRRSLAGILIVVFLMGNSIGQGEYDQYIYSRIHFSSYFFLCYVTTVGLALLFPIMMVMQFLYYKLYSVCGFRSEQYSAVNGQITSQLLLNDSLELKPTPTSPAHFQSGFTWSEYLELTRQRLYENPRFSIRNYVRWSLIISPIFFWGTYMWYKSLDMMPVSINSTLFRAVTVTTVYALSMVFLNEKAVKWKMLAFSFCILGIVLVGIGNYREHNAAATSTTPDKTQGYVLVIVAAFLWGVYEIIYRKTIGEANVYGVLLIETMMGLWIAGTLWFLIPALPALGLEPAVSFSPEVIRFLCINAVFAVSYFLFYALGMTITSPLFMTLAGLCGIPVSMTVDYLLHGQTFLSITIVGSVCVVCGVFAMNVSLCRPDLGPDPFHVEKEVEEDATTAAAHPDSVLIDRSYQCTQS